jgi:acyl carrier protein
VPRDSPTSHEASKEAKLVLELEEEFGVSFPTYRLAEILDLDAIVTAVQELLAEQ